MKKASNRKILVWLLVAVLVIAGASIVVLVKFRVVNDKNTGSPPVVTAAKIAKPSTVTYTAKVLFIGDIMMARTVGQKIVAGKDPFAYVHKILDSYDFRVANIETTIADPKVAVQAKGKLFTFNSPLVSIATLTKAHIDVAGLANNHTRDYGPAATANTIDNLQNAGLKVAGAGKTVAGAFKPLVVDLPVRSGDKTQTVKLAIVALNSIENVYTNVSSGAPGSAYFDRTLDGAEIKQAKKLADIVVVFPHWGVEYQPSPSPDQVAWGRFFIDSGADIVIGGHPHVIEPTVLYKGKYIVYSMGNFVFDEMQGPPSYGQMIGLNINLKDTVGTDGTHAKKFSLSAPTSIRTKLGSDGFPGLL